MNLNFIKKARGGLEIVSFFVIFRILISTRSLVYRNLVDTAVNNKRNNKSKDRGKRNLICTILVEVIPNVSIVGRKRGKCAGDNDLSQQRMDDGDETCNPFP